MKHGFRIQKFMRTFTLDKRNILDNLKVRENEEQKQVC